MLRKQSFLRYYFELCILEFIKMIKRPKRWKTVEKKIQNESFIIKMSVCQIESCARFGLFQSVSLWKKKKKRLLLWNPSHIYYLYSSHIIVMIRPEKQLLFETSSSVFCDFDDRRSVVLVAVNLEQRSKRVTATTVADK